MPIGNGLKRVKTTTIGGGRPRAGQEPVDLWSITVQCPAGLGLVNCVNAALADGDVTPGLPDVPNPPFPGNPHLWPRACTQESVTYRLHAKQIKHLQADMLGTYYQRDMYETMRSANERFHSQLKHPRSGGITNRNWTEINGIAKRGLMFAIATTVTIGHMIEGFDPASEPVSDRETERRSRSKILSRLRRTPEVSPGRKKKSA